MKEDATIVFLSKIENKFVDLLEENYMVVSIDQTKGLNSDRDTEKKVETAIRFFPNILSMERYGSYPIYMQLRTNRGECNLKAASFILLFARLGVELGQFKRDERGGLITERANVLEKLASNGYYKKGENFDEEHQQLVDETFLAVMKRLRKSDLFQKEDIRKYNLLHGLCEQNIFAEQRFRYLADWDPKCLAIPDRYGWLPIHCDMHHHYKYICGYQTVFEVGIRHFPTEIGFLFHKEPMYGETPYQLACREYGREEVEKLLDGAGSDDQENNTIKALIYAVTEEKVHLDCVYFLLRREPVILLA